MKQRHERRLLRFVLPIVLAAAPAVLLAQFMTPHTVTSPPEDATATLGSTIFLNHGLVGVGRISASAVDMFGDSFGSASGLQITDWAKGGGASYSGTFNILPDRGYNVGNFYADYAARINQVGFTFTPHDDHTSIGGTTDLEKIQAQQQIAFTTPIVGVQFRYDDPFTHTTSITTGLDPASVLTLFGRPVPYVTTYTGLRAPGDTTVKTYTNINKLALDSEALVLKPDGSGYIGDEYGGSVYYFDSSKKIVGVIVPPAAFQPHQPAGTLNFGSANTPVNGRRNNQGFEGVSLTPDGTRLFVLLQSATVQDSNAGSNNQLAKHTRLLVYDVSGGPTPASPVEEYALTLPTYKANGNNQAPNKTLAQSEVVALDATRLLVLSRDGNGLGNASHNPSMFKSVLLVDLSVAAPTNFAGDVSRNAEGGKITTAPGVLDPAITPLTWVEAVNMLNGTQLNRFNIELDTDSDAGGAFFHPHSVSKLTLGEKWEGMSLVPALDADRPNDYFLFIANDNDFLTSNGIMRGPEGSVNYNGFSGYPIVGTPASSQASRIPPPVDSANNENDTMFLAYRVTILSGTTPGDVTPPAISATVTGTLGDNGWYRSDVNVTWTVVDPQSGVALLAGCGPTNLTTGTPGITLTCSATNGVGLTSSASVTVKLDKIPPVVALLADLTVPQLFLGGAIVTYPAPAVTETGSGLATFSCAPASGALFPVGSSTVVCSATDAAGNLGSSSFIVHVTPAPDGRIFGVGHLDDDGAHHHFAFRATQLSNRDYGRLEYWVSDPRQCRDDDEWEANSRHDGDRDDDYGRNHGRNTNHFEATSFSAVFSDDPSFGPGGRRASVDTVRLYGAGKWNGRSGYTFEATATDQGEPGRHRDTFAITIKDAHGVIVAQVSGDLDGGNIQSTRLGR